MMLDAQAETPAHAAAVVVGLALEVVVVVVLTADVVVALAEDVVVAGVPLDPVSAALTAWSYLPFAITVTPPSSARPYRPRAPTRDGTRTIGLRRIPEHHAPKGRIRALGLRDDRRERRRAHVAAARGARRSRRTDVHLDVLVWRDGLGPVVPTQPRRSSMRDGGTQRMSLTTCQSSSPGEREIA